MIHNINHHTELKELLASEDALLAYFSTPRCNVCKVLKPQVAEMLEQTFPKMKMVFIDSELFPDVAASFSVFVAPTILIFFGGREFQRKSRMFGIEELKNEIQRPYQLMFD